MSTGLRLRMAFGIVAVLTCLATWFPCLDVVADGGKDAFITATPATALTEPYQGALGGVGGDAVQPGGLFDVFLGLSWRLGLVLALIYGVLWLLRRLVFVKATGHRQMLQVLETVNLGNGRSIHVVRVGRRYLLVGSAQGEVATLADVTEEIDLLPAGQRRMAAGEGNSHGWLASSIGGVVAPVRDVVGRVSQVRRRHVGVAADPMLVEIRNDAANSR